MTFSPARLLVFFLIGLPIGFIVTALAFVTLSQPLAAASLAPWAAGVAAITGLAAAIWKPA